MARSRRASGSSPTTDVEQRGHLGLRQRLGQALGHPRLLEPGGRIVAGIALVEQEPVQRPHRHQGPGHRRRRLARGPQVLHVAAQVVLGDLGAARGAGSASQAR